MLLLFGSPMGLLPVFPVMWLFFQFCHDFSSVRDTYLVLWPVFERATWARLLYSRSL
jgi:hypothetical protein